MTTPRSADAMRKTSSVRMTQLLDAVQNEIYDISMALRGQRATGHAADVRYVIECLIEESMFEELVARYGCSLGFASHFAESHVDLDNLRTLRMNPEWQQHGPTPTSTTEWCDLCTQLDDSKMASAHENHRGRKA
tara:strand:- start:360 stop:764 length:405 start_codon:yes stop_codon:yes gene_type:complete